MDPTADLSVWHAAREKRAQAQPAFTLDSDLRRQLVGVALIGPPVYPDAMSKTNDGSSNLFRSPCDVAARLSELPTANSAWREEAIARQRCLTKPPGSLGRLEDVAVFLAGWGRESKPCAERIKVVIFAGNHGVTKHAVSPYPADITAQMVANYAAGGAAINALAGSFGLELAVVPLSLETPTRDISTQPAMSEDETLAAMNEGARTVEDDLDVLVLGEMGIGNTTIAAALCAWVLGGTGRGWSGPGTGLDAEGVARKAMIVDQALSRHRASGLTQHDRAAFDVLMSLGGRETAAIAGAIIAARLKRIPVLLDGYVVGASLAPLIPANPKITLHCLAGHKSAEPAHSALLRRLGLEPILDLGMRLGEGSGAALACAVVKAAAAAHNQMSTFEQAGVSNRD